MSDLSFIWLTLGTMTVLGWIVLLECIFRLEARIRRLEQGNDLVATDSKPTLSLSNPQESGIPEKETNQ